MRKHRLEQPDGKTLEVKEFPVAEFLWVVDKGEAFDVKHKLPNDEAREDLLFLLMDTCSSACRSCGTTSRSSEKQNAMPSVSCIRSSTMMRRTEMEAEKRITNREFTERDRVFRTACAKLAGQQDPDGSYLCSEALRLCTARQAGKWRRGEGRVWKHAMGIRN